MQWFRAGRCVLVLASVVAGAAAVHASTEAPADQLKQATPADTIVVPEPGAMLLVGTGLLLAARRLRKTS